MNSDRRTGSGATANAVNLGRRQSFRRLAPTCTRALPLVPAHSQTNTAHRSASDKNLSSLGDMEIKKISNSGSGVGFEFLETTFLACPRGPAHLMGMMTVPLPTLAGTATG